jgi:LysR family transcriptional activator of nhaA
LFPLPTITTLSRNFQLEFIKPLLNRNDLELVLHIGLLRDLLGMLDAHTIDLVLSNSPVAADIQLGLQSHLVDEQEVILVGHEGNKNFHFPHSLEGMKIVLPSAESTIRRSFDILMNQHGVRPLIIAEVDDMAMLRLLARETDAITLVPRVVVRDELKNRTLVELHSISQVRESFYAITPSRHFPNALVRELLHSPKRKKKSPTTKKPSKKVFP